MGSWRSQRRLRRWCRWAWPYGGRYGGVWRHPSRRTWENRNKKIPGCNLLESIFRAGALGTGLYGDGIRNASQSVAVKVPSSKKEMNTTRATNPPSWLQRCRVFCSGHGGRALAGLVITEARIPPTRGEEKWHRMRRVRNLQGSSMVDSHDAIW